MKKVSRYNYNGKKCGRCNKEITRNASLCGHCAKQNYDDILTKSFLYDQYIKKEKTIKQIAKKINCGVYAVITAILSKKANELQPLDELR